MLPVRAPSLDQIDHFQIYTYSIGLCADKSGEKQQNRYKYKRRMKVIL